MADFPLFINMEGPKSHRYRRRFGGASEDPYFNGLRCRYHG